MINFYYDIRDGLHACLTQISGRHVSLEKVSKACDQHLGPLSCAPFEHLASGIQDPWQMRAFWSGAYGDLPPKGWLTWYPSRDDALRRAVDVVDQYRLYPDRIDTAPDGRIILVIDDRPVIELEPLRYYEPDPALLALAQDVFAGPGGKWRGEALRRAARMPGLSRQTGPHGASDEHWPPNSLQTWPVRPGDDGIPATDLGAQGMLQITPEGVAAACVAIGEQFDIALPLDKAREVVAKAIGFREWEALRAAWDARTVFQPYLFRDEVAQTCVFCRDAASALAALAGVADTIEQDGTFAWDIRAVTADEYVFSLSGPFEYEIDKLSKITTRAHERERRNPLFERVKVERAKLRNYHYSLRCAAPGLIQREYSIPPGDTASALRQLLGVDLPGASRIQLSDTRAQISAIDVGGVHVTKGRHYEGDRMSYFYECLDPANGRNNSRETSQRLPDAYFGMVWHGEADNELLRTGTGEMTLCETTTKKRPVKVRFRVLSAEDEDRLIDFLDMIPTATGAAYSQSVKDSMQAEQKARVEVMFKDMWPDHFNPTRR